MLDQCCHSQSLSSLNLIWLFIWFSSVSTLYSSPVPTGHYPLFYLKDEAINFQCFRQAARSCFNSSFQNSTTYILNFIFTIGIGFQHFDSFMFCRIGNFSLSQHISRFSSALFWFVKLLFYCVTIVFLPSVSTAIQTNLGARKTSNIRACSLQSAP